MMLQNMTAVIEACKNEAQTQPETPEPPLHCPLQLAFRPLPAGVAPIFKGERQGVQNAYTVTAAFSIPGHDLAGEEAVTYCAALRHTCRPSAASWQDQCVMG